MLPKMKFESREVTTALAVGYTTRIASGPFTSGMGGSGSAGAAGAVPGVGDGAGVATLPAHAAAALSESPETRRRNRMGSRALREVSGQGSSLSIGPQRTQRTAEDCHAELHSSWMTRRSGRHERLHSFAFLCVIRGRSTCQS